MTSIAFNKAVWDQMHRIVDDAIAHPFNYNVHPRDAVDAFSDKLKVTEGALKAIKLVMNTADGKVMDGFCDTIEVRDKLKQIKTIFNALADKPYCRSLYDLERDIETRRKLAKIGEQITDEGLEL